MSTGWIVAIVVVVVLIAGAVGFIFSWKESRKKESRARTNQMALWPKMFLC